MNWRVQAACRGMGDLFAPPDDGEDRTAMLRRRAESICVCLECPVRAECRQWLLLTDAPPRDTVCAGLRPTMWARMRAQPDWIEARRLANRPRCGTNRAYKAHLDRGETCMTCLAGHATRIREIGYASSA